MGNLTSHHAHKEREEDGVTEDGMKTPTTFKDGATLKPFLLDPRSPTIGVSRTPVEVVAERERVRQDRAKKLQTLGLANTNTDVTPTMTSDASTPNVFFDPRSPTFEYKRTPIALDKESGDQDMTPKEYENELQVPVLGNPVCRDLRKRLFVAQLNDSMNASGVQDDNKEN